MTEATAPTRIGYWGASPARIPPPKQSNAEPKTRTECATPSIRPCDSAGAVFESNADMLVVPTAMQAPITGSSKQSHLQFVGVIIRTRNKPRRIALKLVMILGVQRLPMGLINNHCVLTMGNTGVGHQPTHLRGCELPLLHKINRIELKYEINTEVKKKVKPTTVSGMGQVEMHLPFSRTPFPIWMR